jgi:hypothetical protein
MSLEEAQAIFAQYAPGAADADETDDWEDAPTVEVREPKKAAPRTKEVPAEVTEATQDDKPRPRLLASSPEVAALAGQIDLDEVPEEEGITPKPRKAGSPLPDLLASAPEFLAKPEDEN